MSKTSAATALQTAIRFHQYGKLAEAEALFKQVIEKDPTNTTALHAMGILLAERGLAQRAIEHLEEALAIDPKNPNYYKTLGQVYQRMGKHAKAIAALQTSLYINPLDTSTIKLLAYECRKAGDVYAAIQYYQQILKNTPSDGETHFHLGECYFDCGFTTDALQSLERAYRLLPYHYQVAKTYATALLQAGDTSTCEHVLQGALQYYPQNPVLHHLCGLYYFRLDMFDEALAWYERALCHAPDNRALLMDYAVCLRTIGDDRSAEQVLNRISEGLA